MKIPVSLNTSAFCVPERLTQSAWTGHTPFMMWLVEALGPRCFVELGTHTGVSYCAACQTVKALDLATRCAAFDTWTGDAHAGFYGEDVFADLDAHHAPRYGGFSRLVRSTFDAAVTSFEDGSIDLLHIDGLHTYEAVKHDFDTWRPKLAAPAIVLFHDTQVRERGFGVYRLWAELAAQHPSFEFHHEHGLGVLALGGVPAGDVGALFVSADGEHAAAVRQVFARLGDACAEHARALQQAEAARARQAAQPALARFRAAQGDDIGPAYQALAALLTAGQARLELSEFHMLGERLVSAGLHAHAVEACMLGLQRYPGNPALRVIRAEAHLSLGDKDKALVDLEGNSGGNYGLDRVHRLRRRINVIVG